MKPRIVLRFQGEYTLVVTEEAADHLETPAGATLEDSQLTILLSGADSLSAGLMQLQPVVRDQQTKVYALGLESVVGRLELVVRDAKGTDHIHVLPVRRRKLASDAELAELEANWALLRLPVPGAAKRIVIEQGAVGEEASPMQWATAYRHAIRPLRSSAISIRRSPRHAITGQTGPQLLHALRRPTAAAWQAAWQGRRAIETEQHVWQADPVAHAMVTWDAGQLLRTMKLLRRDLGEAHLLPPDLERDLSNLETSLARLGINRKPPRTRQSVLHDARYRDLHRAARLSRRGRSTAPGRIAMQRPPTSELYEAWCARALVEELVPRHERSKALQRLFDAQGQPIEIDGPTGTLALTIQYEMRPSAVSRIRSPARPDFVVRVEDAGRVFIFDAKYRATGPTLARPPMEAMDELHAYRDLFLLHRPDVQHKDVWCAILYPAPGFNSDDATFDAYLELGWTSAARIGAVPVRPGLRGLLQDYLVKTGLADPTRRALG